MDNILKRLSSNTIDSVLYLLYYDPKTQSQLTKYVYGKDNVNISPLKKARLRLIEAKVLKTEGNSISNVPLKSSPKPFIEHLKKRSHTRMTTKGEEHKLTAKDFKYLELILDSDFYRQTFFNNYFFEECFGVHRGVIHYDSDRLRVENAMRYMELVLAVTLISSRYLYKHFNDLYLESISETLDLYDEPNVLLENHFSNISKSDFNIRVLNNELISNAWSYLGLEIYDSTKYEFTNIVSNGFFLLFPPELVLKLNAIIEDSDLLTYYAAYYHNS